MPLNLHGKDMRGHETDGSLSDKFCHYCYENGQFVEPNITFDQMVSKGKLAISNGKGNPIAKFFMKASYPSMLKKTERWGAIQ